MTTLSRRKLLGMAAGAAAGTSWVFALDAKGNVVRAASADGAFTPSILTPNQLDAVAQLCETIIPRTDTPGAIDARVHEYIDVRLSGMYEADRRSFLRGLNWLEGRASLHGRSIAELDAAERISLLDPISDKHDNHSQAVKPGVDFFRTLKNWTIHGYYTSREGRVQTLGLPESQGMQQWVGCTHSEH